MRLWHEALITLLPRTQLLGQHREICALRGNGWQKKHATVNYCFTYSPYKLYQFHLLVLKEMQKRHYQPDEKWFDPLYRGKHCPAYAHLDEIALTIPIYPEHNQDYLTLCLENLAQKNIHIPY